MEMRNHSLLLWVLLFVDGVFGANEEKSVSVPVSVMKGDSVTLHTGVSELQSDDIIYWTWGDDVIKSNTANWKISDSVLEKSFEGRLKLDHQTGSLTIGNITSEHKGIYEVEIRGRGQICKNFSVTVHDYVESLSVLEGDSVTLHTGVTKIQKDDVIQWFGDQGTCIAALNSAVDQRWSNIHLNNQTGELTIRNIQMKQSGVYKVEINATRMILHRKFKITVDGMKHVSVMTGESIILLSGVLEIREYNLILWKFEDHPMAKISKKTNQFLLYDRADGKFKGRLKLNREAGDLTISDSRTTDSGVYDLHMSNSAYTLQRPISVTVKASGLHPGYIALICVCVVLVPMLVALVIYYRRRDHEII